ncbi:MAG: 3-isopropylmalate dehydratase small subunit [Pseudomonadota bacterium]|nr:3-isopropylmalate dehydratase small subunit [Pseudomonadota bacterium]
MEPFKTFASIAVPIDIANCDTDQIIPARFLRRGKNDPEYSKFLFHDLRFNEDGSEKDFLYNKLPYRDGRIFVADVNWGCGSSRENAVTALDANGVRSVIAPSIADIHYNNCIKNGVLPIRMPEEVCAKLRDQLRESPGAEIAIDLDSQSVSGPDQTTYKFEINAFDKHRLLNGLDDVGLTMEFDDKIEAFKLGYQAKHGWASFG